MNFKAPRDPNTDPGLRKIRDISPSEGLTCQVGNGECKEPAIEEQDGGGDDSILLCAQHAKEFRALAVLVAEMTPDQINAFESAINKSHENP